MVLLFSISSLTKHFETISIKRRDFVLLVVCIGFGWIWLGFFFGGPCCFGFFFFSVSHFILCWNSFSSAIKFQAFHKIPQFWVSLTSTEKYNYHSMFLLKISSLLFYTWSYTLLAKNQHKSLASLYQPLHSITCSCFRTSFLSNSLHTCFAATFSQDSACSSKPSSAEISPNLTSCLQLEWMEKDKKQFKFTPSFDAYMPSLKPHLSSFSHITAALQNSFHSQHQELQLFLRNWIQQAKINTSQVFSCSNDDFCCVQYYLAFSFYFILN